MNPSYQRALILHAQGRYADAKRELHHSLDAAPMDPHAHAMLGLCLVHLEDFTAATVEAQTAVGLSPGLPLAHYVLAFVMYKRQRPDEALPAIYEAIRLEPDNADFFALFGSLRMDQRNWPSALEAAETGLSHDPEHVPCNNLRAMALVKLGRAAEAGATIGAALRRAPEDADSHANQGWTLLHERQPKPALEHFREALRLNPDHKWARAGIVEALKARFFLYRWLLAYFLWMGRLSRRAQWAIIVIGYFGNQYLLSIARENPALGKFVWPILITYISFVILTWLSYPMFNLLLRLSRFGRAALTRVQTIESNCIGLLLAGALAAAAVFWSTHGAGWECLACVLGVLILPVSGIFRADPGWPQITSIAIAATLAAIGLLSAGLDFLHPHLDPILRPQVFRLADGAFDVFLYGTLISSFAVNWLLGVRPKR